MLWYIGKYDKPIVLQAATGAGKSLMIADLCHKVDRPTLILQPSKEILEQNYQKLLSYGVKDVAIYSASAGQKNIGRYTYATIGSIYKKPELFQHFEVVIIDECHLVDPKNYTGMYKTFLGAINPQNIIGLTATPYRIVQKYVRDGGKTYYTASLQMINRIPPFFFRKIVYQIETGQLIEEGYLSPIKYYADSVDVSDLKVNSTGQDFTDASIQKFWNEKRLRRIAQAIQHADSHNDRSLTFCSSILQARRAQELCKALGIKTLMVTGKTPKDERETAVRAFREGKIPHMLNVGVFTTGFDVPALDTIILARPTMSLALYYQMVGRGVRINPENPDKVLQVYDLAGVVERLGRVESIKVVKEEDGFRDKVISESGVMTDKPLFTFLVKKQLKFKVKE